MLLPRENLSLSTLDLSQPHGDFPTSRLFESNIKILDLEGRLGSNVLLARSDTTRMVYAVERESNGLYVLCKLGSWVDIESLSQSATVVCKERMKSSKPPKPHNDDDAAFITPSMYDERKKRRVAIEEIQSLVRKRSMSVIEKEVQSQTAMATEEKPAPTEDASQAPNPAQDHTGTPIESTPSVSSRLATPALDLAPIDDPLAPPNVDDIFQNIRAQYMEALYHSKVRCFLANPAPRDVLTNIGLVGVFRKRIPFQGQSGLPFGLGLQP
jgi:DNA replication regulator SLD3